MYYIDVLVNRNQFPSNRKLFLPRLSSLLTGVSAKVCHMIQNPGHTVCARTRVVYSRCKTSNKVARTTHTNTDIVPPTPPPPSSNTQTMRYTVFPIQMAVTEQRLYETISQKTGHQKSRHYSMICITAGLSSLSLPPPSPPPRPVVFASVFSAVAQVFVGKVKICLSVCLSLSQAL